MISKGKIKLIKSLAHRKYRLKELLFVVEGNKNVIEVVNSEYTVTNVWATETFLNENESILTRGIEITEASQEEIKKASLLKNPQQCLALCKIPESNIRGITFNDQLTLYLDGIQDPGNLGTIIRTCDWFGIEQIYCSADTADLYNPKVIQATMGSFCRCRVYYSLFDTIALAAHKNGISIYGAFLQGKNIYQTNFPDNVLLIVGNEGHGIRSMNEKYIQQKINIPEFRKSRGAESINVAVATGIICSEIKRQMNYSK
jgi:TrmH family RNA methyltransferase